MAVASYGGAPSSCLGGGPTAMSFLVRRGQLGPGTALDGQRNKIPYPSLLESRMRVLGGSRDLMLGEMRILAGQSALNLGDQKVFADLGHVDSLRRQGRPSTGTKGAGHCPQRAHIKEG
jgi:hypothetical protein